MPNKIMHIVGNRPQFIKLAPVSKEIRKRGYKEIIIHTGQHYDKNMSDIFFSELDIPQPDVNLGIGSGSHAQMTAKAMIEIEKVVEKFKPKVVILYGDTNSTLAASVVCSKLNIPIAHVESGSRSYNKANPEEQNRIITDHMSTILFCSDNSSVINLDKENIKDNVFFTGDVMYDTFLFCKRKNNLNLLDKYKLEKDNFILMTWHRQENTESIETVNKIVNFISKIGKKIIFPIHPRTKKVLENYNLYKKLSNKANIIITDPLGYIEMVELLSNCSAVLTDSGGLSKESSFGGSKCYFMLDLYSWPELSEINWINYIDFNDKKNITDNIQNLNNSKRVANSNLPKFYGEGDASSKIVNILENIGLI